MVKPEQSKLPGPAAPHLYGLPSCAFAYAIAVSTVERDGAFGIGLGFGFGLGFGLGFGWVLDSDVFFGDDVCGLGDADDRDSWRVRGRGESPDCWSTDSPRSIRRSTA